LESPAKTANSMGTPSASEMAVIEHEKIEEARPGLYIIITISNVL
jgi:hypothetical protein